MPRDLSWKDFSLERNALEASHRGLQRELIPQWLDEPRNLSARIDSSAYGETPPELIDAVLDLLGLKSGELFADLGSGGGNVCHGALLRGSRAIGVERNPELHKLALDFLGDWLGRGLELRCEDLSDTHLAGVHAVYSTTARFPEDILAILATKLHLAQTITRVACLGRPLSLGSEWERSEAPTAHAVRWNQGEQTLLEPLFFYRRIC